MNLLGLELMNVNSGVFMNSFSDRLIQRMHDLNLNQVTIYTRIGVSRGTISGWVSGKMDQPRGDNLEKLAKVLRCSAKWLAFGDDEDLPTDNGLGLDSSQLGTSNKNFVNIPIYDIELSAGNGRTSNGESITGEYPIHQSIIESMGVPASEAAIVKVRGDSMTDTLWDGDVVLIHTADKTPISDKIYAFRLDNELRVKRFFKQLDGSWRVVSDSNDKGSYPDEVVSAHNIEQLTILGRVRRVVDREM